MENLKLKCKECMCLKLIKDNYYKHPEWKFWVLWRCKDCIKKWRKTEKELIMSRARDMKRYNNPDNKKRYYIFKKAKERRIKMWYWSIHCKTHRFISKKNIRPKRCSVCWNKHKRIMAHHIDYKFRYKVVFCCPICHTNIHLWKIEKDVLDIVILTDF